MAVPALFTNTSSRPNVVTAIEWMGWNDAQGGRNKLYALEIFVGVVEKGSCSAVAKERGIGQPAVSKHISALEEELRTELIHRTSRSTALTEAGRPFSE